MKAILNHVSTPHLFATLAWLAFVAGQAAAQPVAEPQPRVGRWGDLARLEFHGVQTFATNDIVNALLQTPGYLLGAHPAAPRQEFGPALAKAVIAGYRNSGFRDASVSVTLDEARQRVRVEVTEGPRFRCGSVRVEHARKVPVKELERRLTQKVWPKESRVRKFVVSAQESEMADREDAVWPAGEPVSFDELAEKTRRTSVERALADCGFFFPKFKIRLEPQRAGDRVNLAVQLESEGPHGTVGDLTVDGLVRHTPAQFLKWLGVKSGQPLTADLVPRLERQIVESGRFLSQAVTPERVIGDDGKVALRFELKEFTNSPALGQPFSATEQHLLRARSWTEAAFLRGGELLVEFNLTNVVVDDGGQSLSARLQLALRRDAFVLLQYSGGKLSRGVLATTNGVAYVSHVSGRRFESPLWSDLRFLGGLLVKPNPDMSETNGPFHFRFEAGFSHRLELGQSPAQFSLQVVPGAMIHKARKPGATSRTERGVLHFGTRDEQWKVRTATGELVEFSLRHKPEDGGEVLVTTRLMPGAVTRAERELRAAGAMLPNLLRTNRPVASSLGVLLAELADSPLAKFGQAELPEDAKLQPAARAIQRLLLSGVLDAIERPIGKTLPQAEYYFIPSEPPTANLPELLRAMWGQFSATVHRYSQEYLPADSWPATLTREGVMIFGGNPKYAEIELMRLFESPKTGPIGCLAAAQLLAHAGNQSGSALFAQRGLERLDAESFRSDSDLLLSIVDTLVRRSETAMATLPAMTPEEISGLASLLPASGRGFLVKSVVALKTQPDRGLRDVLGPLLGDWWQSGLNKDVERLLRETLASATGRTAGQRLFDEGTARLQGTDGPADAAQAARLFRQSAELGNAFAAHQLGVMHENGLGVERSMAAAMTWYERAATKGVIEAQMKLGDAYSNGLDAPADYVAATFWYRLAELGGNPVARVFGSTTARRLTAAQQAEVDRRLKALVPLSGPGGPGDKKGDRKR